MKIYDILMEKARKDSLAHFYIVESAASLEAAQEDLLNFVHEFIKNYYREVEGHKQSMTSLMDHPDVFVLGMNQDEDKKEAAFYSVEEAMSLGRFFEWKPVQSKRKFAVILNAHRINTMVSNKWLKLLEEPPANCTIFMLNPKRVKLLDTIHSRALHLRLPHKKEELSKEEWNKLLTDAGSMTLSPFLENYVKSERPLGFWVEELLRWESEQTGHVESKNVLHKWVKDYSEMEVFHQSAATKWTLFYHHLKEHVLNRL